MYKREEPKKSIDINSTAYSTAPSYKNTQDRQTKLKSGEQATGMLLHATKLPSQQNNIKVEMLNSFFSVINAIFQFS